MLGGMSEFLFVLKKLLTFCVMPLTASLGLILGGLVLQVCDRSQRLGRIMIWLGALILLTASHRQVGFHLLAPLENQYPAIPKLADETPLPANLADCRYVVVLGGEHVDLARLPATSKLSPSALARVTETVRIARLLPDAKIITSGPAYPGYPSHAAILATAAESLGISADRFVLIDNGRDTENETRVLLRLIGDAPFALVTSAWHMPRSMGLMRSAGLNPVACPTDFKARRHEHFVLSDYTWGLEGLECSTWAVYERLGYLWARLRGLIKS